MESVKPLLAENGLTLIMRDDITLINDRYYITAKATLVNSDKPEETITTQAMARESLSKKGMDESQITGATSSYARKYCLNGLFAIDDTKDADSLDNSRPLQAGQQQQNQGMTPDQLSWLQNFCIYHKMQADDKKALMLHYKFSPATTPPAQFEMIKKQIEAEYQNNKESANV
jgi:hypothetical protein